MNHVVTSHNFPSFNAHTKSHHTVEPDYILFLYLNICTSSVSKELLRTIVLGYKDDWLVLEFQSMNPLSRFFFPLHFLSVKWRS